MGPLTISKFHCLNVFGLPDVSYLNVCLICCLLIGKPSNRMEHNIGALGGIFFILNKDLEGVSMEMSCNFGVVYLIVWCYEVHIIFRS